MPEAEHVRAQLAAAGAADPAISGYAGQEHAQA
jgi:hypothetical protein